MKKVKGAPLTAPNPGREILERLKVFFPGVASEEGAEEPQQPDPVGLPEEAEPGGEEPQT